MLILNSCEISTSILFIRCRSKTERYRSLAASLVNFRDSVNTCGKVDVPAVKLIIKSCKESLTLTALIPAREPKVQLGHNLSGVKLIWMDPLHEVGPQSNISNFDYFLFVLLHIFRGSNWLDRDWYSLLLVLRADLELIIIILLLTKNG